MTVRLGLLNGNMGYHPERSGIIMDVIPDQIKKLGQSVKNIKRSRYRDKKQEGSNLSFMEDILCLERKQKMKTWS